MPYEKIHRKSYRPTKAARRVEKAVILKVPALFKQEFDRCRPSTAEVKEFDNIDYRRIGRDFYAYEKGWHNLGCGVHRCAVRYKTGCVAKVAKTRRAFGLTGPGANKYEVAVYAHAKPELQDILTPIVAHDSRFRWIIVPEVKTEETMPYTEVRKVQDDLRERMRSIGVECEDLHSANVGKLRENPVILDYGFGITCKVKAIKQMTLGQFREEIKKTTPMVLPESPKKHLEGRRLATRMAKQVNDFFELKDDNNRGYLRDRLIEGRGAAKNLIDRGLTQDAEIIVKRMSEDISNVRRIQQRAQG